MRAFLGRLAVAAFVTAHALAAAPWDKEPKAVLGIALGAPFPSNIPPCARVGIGSGVFCADTLNLPIGQIPLQLFGLPFKDMAVRAFVAFRDGKVASIEFDVKHDDYDRFRSILIERYGEPSSREQTTVTSQAGVTLPSATLRWVGSTVSIVSLERSEVIDNSKTRILDNSLLQAEAEGQEKADRAAASSL